MAQLNKHQVPSARRVPRAQRMDRELTAQPRPLPDELALEASAEPELSVDADELGARFLRDAIQQGDFDPERGWPEESNLGEAPARDQPLGSTNFVAGNSVWEQTVDLEMRTQGAAAQLREPATPSAVSWDSALRDTLPDPINVQDNSAHTLDNHVRDFSLFDARDSDAARRQRAPQKRRTRGAAPRLGWPARVLRALLTRSAMSLRTLANWLQRGPS